LEELDVTRARSATKSSRRVAVDSKYNHEAVNSWSPDSALRKTGIRVIGQMPWGTHICVFYDTKEDLLETCAAYFEAGLQSNEFCVWAVSHPATEQNAKAWLSRRIPGFDRYLANGQIEILRGPEWYLKGEEFDLQRITGGWKLKLIAALDKGYAGMRVSGNAFWIEGNYWKEFCEYERELDTALAGQKMTVLCTYSLRAYKAVDLMDVAKAHQLSIARRKGEWEFLETPDLKQAKQEIKKLRGALDILSKPFPGHEQLTQRERVTLSQIITGASSKEAGRSLGVSPRTVEFHRANIMQKLGAKNTVDLVRKVLAEH
jgi:DNA-binding CsgD family transcriptional regulator